MALTNQSVTLVDNATISSNTYSTEISLMQQGMANDKSDVMIIMDIESMGGSSPSLEVVVLMPVAGKDYILDTLSTRSAAGQTIHLCKGVPSVIKLLANVGGVGASIRYSVHAVRV